MGKYMRLYALHPVLQGGSFEAPSLSCFAQNFYTTRKKIIAGTLKRSFGRVHIEFMVME